MSPGVARAIQRLRSKGLRGLCDSIACRAAPWQEWVREKYFEWRLGISTAGDIAPEELGHRHPDAHAYEPSFYGSVSRILRELGPVYEEDVFVDFGSGKGRVLILAGQHRFRKIIGVEFSSELNGIARRNIERARQGMRCDRIELVTMDAARYEIPDDATTLYFANPFSGEILDAVLRNIQASLVRAPRTISVVSHSHEPTYPFERQIRQCPWLEVRKEVRLQRNTSAWIYANNHWITR